MHVQGPCCPMPHTLTHTMTRGSMGSRPLSPNAFLHPRYLRLSQYQWTHKINAAIVNTLDALWLLPKGMKQVRVWLCGRVFFFYGCTCTVRGCVTYAVCTAHLGRPFSLMP